MNKAKRGSTNKRFSTVLAVALASASLLAACSKAGSDNAAGEAQDAHKPITITFWEQGWDGPQDDKILPVLDEQTGVTLKYEPWVVTTDEERHNKLSLMSASGEIPDVFFGSTDTWDRSLFNKMGEQGKLWDLTPFLKKYPNVKQAVDRSIPLFRDDKTKETYLYPTQVAFSTSFPLGFNVRKDWMDQLGLSYPTTIDEFYQLLKTFKEKIKPTSGESVIPLAFGPDLSERESWWIVPWFGEDTITWSKGPDGNYTLKHLTDIPHLQDMLAFYNKLYREGLLDPEALMIKDSQLKEKIGQDRVGVELLNDFETSSLVDSLQAGQAKDAMYVLMPWFFDDGVEGTYAGNRKLSPGAPSGLYVSKKLSETQVDDLFKAMDWILTQQGQLLVNFGIEGDHWEYDADHKVVKTQAFLDRAKGDWNKEAHEGVGYYQQLGTYYPAYSDLIPDETKYPRPNSKINDEVQQKQWSDKPFEDLDPMSYVNPGPIEQSKLPTINSAWKDMVIKAILAKSEDEARATANGWTDTLKNLGWDDIVKERMEALQHIDLNW